ncbi:MAG: DUF3332 family protein [Bacteroidales bacterium]|nr:DUF3332 family protein [Candidatus Liminaster caballi]
MKKTKFINSILILAFSSQLLSSCAVGSFSALNWCWNLNNTITGNKYINSIIAFVLAPFEFFIGGLIDTAVLNTIEFWTGSNPLASTKIIMGTDGYYYAVKPDKNGGYIIENQATGQKLALLFEPKTKTWTAEFDSNRIELFSLIDEMHASVNTSDGNKFVISLNEAGITAYREKIEQSNLAVK